jgi:ABC-type amino acid transport substrate-binding protein
VKKLTLVFVALMALALAGCSGGEKTGKIESVPALKDKVICTVSPAMPQQKLEASIANYIGEKPKQVTFYNRMTDCVAALLAGKVDAVFGSKFIAEYYAKKNNGLKAIFKQTVPVNAVMALRNEDTQLRDDLDKAITALKDNGALKRLETEWVTNLPASGEPPTGKDIPKIEGAKTVYVGVCGDYVPLDYIAANGRPAGFNVALLAEIGKLMNVNFEFVSLETPARFAALSAKKIDLIFCNLEGNSVALQALKNSNWIATKPYFSSEGRYFLMKK